MAEFIIGYILVVLVIIAKRFVANPAGSLCNPLFYLVGFGALYFLLPASYLEYILLVAQFSIDETVVNQCRFWSFWYESVFLIFYLCSEDSKLVLSDSKPTKGTESIAWWLNLALCFFLIFILLVYVPPIMAIRSDRGAAFELYEYSLNSPFRFRQITYCHMVVMFILVWGKRNLKYLLPCLGYLIIDYSHGGRTSSLIIFLFAYFCIILISGKTYIKYALVFIIGLTAIGLLQRSDATELSSIAFTAGVEFSNTYLTTAYMVATPDCHLDGLEYAIVSIMKIFPGGIVDKLTGFLWYGDILSERIGIGYGLAGNLITEALIYGGKFFALINPILIGGLMYLFNGMTLKKTLAGFLWVMLICFTMQVTVRQFFWGFVLYPLQIVLFYCIWAFPSFKQKIFI